MRFVKLQRVMVGAGQREREDKERLTALSLRLSQKIYDIPVESLWRFDRG
jgi:hypothetical protein